MKARRNVLSVASLIIFLLTAFTTQLAMAADPVGSAKEDWRMRKEGNIVHGSGSYFLSEDTKTMLFRDIKTEKEAWAKVLKLAIDNPSNPPIMWQLAHHSEVGPRKGYPESGSPETRKKRWKGSPGYLVVHFKKFMSTPDLDVFGIKDKWTTDSTDCFTAELECYAKEKHAHPEGHPLYFVPDSRTVPVKCTLAFAAKGPRWVGISLIEIRRVSP